MIYALTHAFTGEYIRLNICEEGNGHCESWVGCLSGALEESGLLPGQRRRDVDAIAPLVHDEFMSALMRAVKPATRPEAQTCCGTHGCAPVTTGTKE